MVDNEQLKEQLHKTSLTNTDKLLICLAVDVNTPKSIKDIKSTAKSAGLRKIETWNVSDYLSKSKGLAIRTNDGWELTNGGKKHVIKLIGPAQKKAVPQIVSKLRKHLPNITSIETKEFLDEAIKCFESKLYRAAVVLSWVGAISLLYDHVIHSKLKEFNAEARKRNPKWKDAITKDDLACMKEYEFLQVINSISIIGKSVKDELESCLKFRNGCGHPNSLKIGEGRVSGHIESLILNVFSVF